MDFSAHSIDCGCIGVLVDILRVSLLSFYIFMSDRIVVRMIMKIRMITVSNKKTTEITYIYSY